MTIDLDKLEELAKAVGAGPAAQKSADPILRNMGRLEHDDAIRNLFRELTPANILALIAEVRALRERNRLAQNAILYADSVCGMLRQGGWHGKAEALESRIKAVIDFDKENA